ncbi:E3 ubiquitin-protein ligase MIB2 [Anthonomus grandis grandis]|uniref:E3 ubiquitin-protein ligase MIB2 n=1 Tax=Anthonomus grandis grandis TaxID=2921223 RepID=UPI00216626E2|nr:E3 ubiquitin-protein ligase MIB2 [Anthonomus grandis grandis]
MLVPGLRIVRGPDWAWGDQDGGEGFVGTVCELGKPGTGASPEKTVVVQWDNGARTNYRVGYMGKYDLRIIDNAQIGIKHPNTVCDSCKVQGISGMSFRCKVCPNYDLCYKCYHNDKHDLVHQFMRFDTALSPGVLLPPREKCRKGELKGIYEGAKVIRGFNWEWSNQDGGEGKVGTVIDIRGWDNETSRSVVNIQWSSGNTNVYRLGHKGICDIKFIQPTSGGSYYPDHLPVLGQNIEPPIQRPARSGPLPFGVGDKVQVTVTLEQLKSMQQGHGGWNPRMAEYIGKIGLVHRVTDKGDIRVQYEGCNNRWTFNPEALHKIISFAVGDIVTLISDAEKVKELQKGHGEWIDYMKNSLGKLGKVLKIYGDGDLRVQLDGTVWTLNPLCVKTVPGSAAELANTMHANQNQRQGPSIEWHPGVHNTPNPDSNASVDALVRAAAQGHLEAVQRLVEGPSRVHVNARSSGKTALQVAAHQGHIAVVTFLLRHVANVNISDTDGDTCLHYAAFGNQPEVLDLLIKVGADLNVANRSGCTALHVAANKQPARCAQLLLAAGADPNRVDLYGDTALHDAIGKDCLQAVELLCTTPGTDFTLRNKRGFNVLHQAALKGKNWATQCLLQHARQLVNVKKDDGFSALHLAALNGHREVVETLIRVGQAEIDLRNNRNQTALLLAVSQGHSDVIETLIRLKADVNATDEDGDSALHMVLMKRTQLTREITESHSPQINQIFLELPVSEHKLALAIACFLIRKGINIDAVNSKGQHALDLLQEPALQDLLRSYVVVVEETQEERQSDLPQLDLLVSRLEGYNLTKNSPGGEPRGNRRSRRNEAVPEDDVSLGNITECRVCSEVTEENVKLEPCGHKPVCEDCSSRMKKCLVCDEFVQKRVTKDGRVVQPKNRQPSAERVKYLENKIAEFEESHACSICMERKRNVVFLCGHGTCQVCADTLRTCHMCRKTITKKIPIY